MAKAFMVDAWRTFIGLTSKGEVSDKEKENQMIEILVPSVMMLEKSSEERKSSWKIFLGISVDVVFCVRYGQALYTHREHAVTNFVKIHIS